MSVRHESIRALPNPFPKFLFLNSLLKFPSQIPFRFNSLHKLFPILSLIFMEAARGEGHDSSCQPSCNAVPLSRWGTVVT